MPKPEREEEAVADEEYTPLARVEEALSDIITLCHRSSHGLNQQQREVGVSVCVCVHAD